MFKRASGDSGGLYSIDKNVLRVGDDEVDVVTTSGDVRVALAESSGVYGGREVE